MGSNLFEENGRSCHVEIQHLELFHCAFNAIDWQLLLVSLLFVIVEPGWWAFRVSPFLLFIGIAEVLSELGIHTVEPVKTVEVFVNAETPQHENHAEWEPIIRNESICIVAFA